MSLNLYTYGWNNPLRYTDPTGHNVCGFGGAGTDWCNNYFGQVGSYAQDLWYTVTDNEVYTATKAVAQWAIVDDINTVSDPNSSMFERSLAAASFIPVGKLIKGGRLAVNLANKYRTVSREVEITAELLSNSRHFVSKSLDNVISSATFESKKAGTMLYRQTGGYDRALEDFAGLGLQNISSITNGFKGDILDEAGDIIKTINVRTISTDKASQATLEIYERATKNSTKIRYGE
ncbi:hypothetical protein [Paenibacillus sp. EPM92]|uniref:hypothetical protein n=1 Tax=Paenibacillus sp. EPM92 TaxID=1561195 RepID=UPI001916615D|nr:hypothetical protein [Paenibacillus sp. EPM92]